LQWRRQCWQELGGSSRPRQKKQYSAGEELTFLDLQVSNDDIGLVQHTEANAFQCNRSVRAKNRGVGSNLDNGLTGKRSCIKAWRLKQRILLIKATRGNTSQDHRLFGVASNGGGEIT